MNARTVRLTLSSFDGIERLTKTCENVLYHMLVQTGRDKFHRFLAHRSVQVHVLLLLASTLGWASEPLRVTVTDSFGSSQAHFQAVAQEVAAIIADKFQFRPPIDVPIQCILGDIPETLALPGLTVMRLTAKEQYWAQLAFQLGHELGHVYLGPLRANGFVETLATAISLEVLDELAKRWALAPAIPGTSSWAEKFSKYRVENEAIEIAKLPEIKESVAGKDWNLIRYYLRLRNSDMQQLTRVAVNCEEGRALEMLAAMSLRSGPVDWPRLVGFAHSSSIQTVNESSGNVVYARVRPDLVHPALCRMGLGCSSALVAAELKERPPNGVGVYFQNTWYMVQEVEPKKALRTLDRLCKRRTCISSLIN